MLLWWLVLFPQSICQEFLILYLFNYLIYIFFPYYSVSITKVESRSVLFPCWCSLISDSALFNNVRSKQKPSKPASLFDVHAIWLYPHSSFSQGIRLVICLVPWKLLILAQPFSCLHWLPLPPNSSMWVDDRFHTLPTVHFHLPLSHCASSFVTPCILLL